VQVTRADRWLRAVRLSKTQAAVTLLGSSWVLALGFVVSTPSRVERSVARGVYSLPDAVTPVLEVTMQAGTRGAIVVLAALLTVTRRWRAAAAALLAGSVAWTTMQLMKALFERPRPTALLDHVPRDSADGWAFPSGHATVAVALATIVVLMVTERRSVRWAAATVAALTCLARVHLGVHWPLDVAAGAVVGALVAWATTAILQPIRS
jgi:membrane-associated phospholipid phosphatase